MTKRFSLSPTIISACAAAYMLFVFVDLTFLTVPDAVKGQSLIDKYFPIVFLVVGVYMLRVAWDQYKVFRNGSATKKTVGTIDTKSDHPANNSAKSK